MSLLPYLLEKYPIYNYIINIIQCIVCQQTESRHGQSVAINNCKLASCQNDLVKCLRIYRIQFFPQNDDCLFTTGYQLLKILVAQFLACSTLSCTLLASLQLQLAVKFCRFTAPTTCSHLGRYGRALFFLQGIAESLSLNNYYSLQYITRI